MNKTKLLALLDANVHVLGGIDDASGQVWIQNGRAHYGTSATPFFSSVQILQASVDFSQNYLSMTTRTLLALLPQSDFVVNPRSADRQEISSAMARQLLDGSYFADVSQGFGSKFRSILSLKKKH